MTTVAMLSRLVSLAGSDACYVVGGELVDADTTADVAVDLGPVVDAWWTAPLPPCPDCGGELEHAEAGSVPGARRCAACGSVFVVETRVLTITGTAAAIRDAVRHERGDGPRPVNPAVLVSRAGVVRFGPALAPDPDEFVVRHLHGGEFTGDDDPTTYTDDDVEAVAEDRTWNRDLADAARAALVEAAEVERDVRETRESTDTPRRC